MDEKSRKMIESMLAEEEFYSGRTQKGPLTIYSHVGTSTLSSKPYPTGSSASRTTATSVLDPPWTGAGRSSSNSKGQDNRKRKNSNERSGQTKRTASEGIYNSRFQTKMRLHRSIMPTIFIIPLVRFPTKRQAFVRGSAIA